MKTRKHILRWRKRGSIWVVFICLCAISCLCVVCYRMTEWSSWVTSFVNYGRMHENDWKDVEQWMRILLLLLHSNNKWCLNALNIHIDNGIDALRQEMEEETTVGSFTTPKLSPFYVYDSHLSLEEENQLLFTRTLMIGSWRRNHTLRYTAVLLSELDSSFDALLGMRDLFLHHQFYPKETSTNTVTVDTLSYTDIRVHILCL